MPKRKGKITRPPGYQSRHLNVVLKEQQENAAESGAYPIEVAPEKEPEQKNITPSEILNAIRAKQYQKTKDSMQKIKRNKETLH